MTLLHSTITAFAIITIAACSASKKNMARAAAPAPAPANAPASTSTGPASAPVFSMARSADGVYEPGNEELAAIQARYREATMGQLQEGYAIYAQGACIKCHGAMNIYRHDELQWKGIIDDMAQKARISDAQKDAVYKYVLAIKAVQLK